MKRTERGEGSLGLGGLANERGAEHDGSGDEWSLRGPLVVWDKITMVKTEAGL